MEMRKESGFSLIEIVVAIAIIGILAMVALPAYTRYQAQARKAEAKIVLSAIYVAERTFHSEFNAYIAGMDSIGYAPEGSKRFYRVGWNATSNPGMVAGYVETPAIASYDRENVPATFNTCPLSPLSDLPAPAELFPQNFSVVATGQIMPDSEYCDTWTINAEKQMANSESGI